MTQEEKLLTEAKAKLEAFQQAQQELADAVQAVDDYVNELSSLSAEMKSALSESSAPASSTPKKAAKRAPANRKPKAPKASDETVEEPASEAPEATSKVAAESPEINLFENEEISSTTGDDDPFSDDLDYS